LSGPAFVYICEPARDVTGSAASEKEDLPDAIRKGREDSAVKQGREKIGFDA
jgi:hypothetical protein